MCKSYRYAYQNCTKECSKAVGRDMLAGLGEQVCSHIDDANENTKDDRMSCAAGFVTSQMMAAAEQGPTR